MKVLSLFDGISCWRLALKRAGIPVTAYYASEIDKFAAEISYKNFPDIYRVYEVEKIFFENGWLHYWEDFVYKVKPDIIIGGSPCQNLSRAGNKKWLQWEKSSLFWEFLRILKEIKPKYFLFENVASMSNENLHTILKEFQKIYPEIFIYKINSLDIVPQNRKRVYFTNFPVKNFSKKKNSLEEFLEKNQEWKKLPEKYLKKYEKILSAQHNLGVLTLARWFNTGSFQHYCPTITSSSWQHNNFLIKKENGEIFYRKFTPIECERLQALPDNYTEWVSNSQRYKMIGNAWTVDVIANILSYLQ